MVFRFQKRVKIAPGVRLNVSKSGISTSLGGRGSTVNLSSKGVRTTVGISGTGLSWSKQTGWAEGANLKPSDELKELSRLLDNIARELNSLSSKADKASTAWNKSIETFEGGRGPSQSKLNTLSKRYETTLKVYEKIEHDILDKQGAINAISQRLENISFGLFSGSLRKDRKYSLTIANEHQKSIDKSLDAIKSLQQEVAKELEAAESRV